MVDTALKGMSRSFSPIYVNWGRPSTAPDKVLRALLLQVLYSIPQRADAGGAVGV